MEKNQKCLEKKSNQSYDIITVATPVIDHYYQVKKNELTKININYGCTNFVSRKELLEYKKEFTKNYVFTYPGDNARNTFETLGRLLKIIEENEFKANYIGSVGANQNNFIKIFDQSLKDNGINTTLFKKKGDFGEILCLVDEEGQRTFIADLGVSEHLKLDNSLIHEIVDNTFSVHMTSITLLTKNEISYTAKKIFDYAILKNKFFIISLESPKMLSDNKVKILEILKKSNLVFANEEEIKAVFGDDYLTELKNFIQRNSSTSKLFYIKLGEQGSMLIKDDGQLIKCPAFKTNKIVDTTAAGDNYIAGVLFGLLLFNDEINAMNLGNYLGNLTIQSLGPSIRNLEKVLSKESLMNFFIV